MSSTGGSWLQFYSNAINCTEAGRTTPVPLELDGLSSPFPASPPTVRNLVNQYLSENTMRGYRADMAHFVATGRTLPSTPQVIAAYLAQGVNVSAVATMERRLAALSKAHTAMGAEDLTKSELVRATLRGIRRSLGVARRQARALLRDDLFAILNQLEDRPKDVRDRALLLIGFALAARRSELVALDFENVEFTDKGEQAKRPCANRVNLFNLYYRAPKGHSGVIPQGAVHGARTDRA